MDAKPVNISRRIGCPQLYETICLYGLSVGLPILIALFVLKQQGFYPFGSKTLFIMDMKDQYLEFFASLRNVVSGEIPGNAADISGVSEASPVKPGAA